MTKTTKPYIYKRENAPHGADPVPTPVPTPIPTPVPTPKGGKSINHPFPPSWVNPSGQSANNLVHG